MDRKIWFGHSEFSLFLWWVSTVSNPQPNVLWHVSDNLMILILKAKLFNFLCNISLIPFMDLKMFNLRATLAIITSMYVTSKGKFSNQYIYIYMQDTKTVLLLTGKIFSHWKLPVIIFADEVSKPPKNWYYIFPSQSYWESRTTGNTFLQGVFPKELAPLTLNLTVAMNCVATDLGAIFDLLMRQFKNSHLSAHLGFIY